MDRKNRQIKFFEEQVRGQFQQIEDRVGEQMKIFAKVEDHLRKEIAFRQKVFSRQKGEVIKLIEEFEEQEYDVADDKEQIDTALWDYSDLLSDLKVVQQSLATTHLDMRMLAISTDFSSFSLSVIPAARAERQKRTRDI